MKAIIIFVFYCVLSFYEASVISVPTSASPNQTEASPNQTESTPQSSASSSHPTTTVPTPRADLDHSGKVQPTKGCPTATPAYNELFDNKLELMVAGGLILACTILLISTLLLACKVCQLSRRLKMLSGHSDPVVPTKYGKDNNKSDADAKETAVLMDDLNQTRDEAGDGGNGPDVESKGEEKEEVRENGVEQKENGAKNEEVKETPAAASEDPSSPKEEGEKSHVDKAETAAASGEKGEVKEGE